MPQPAPQPPQDLLPALHRVFGFDGFRSNQEGIVRAILGGKDVFAVMPTGGGKSLCYQLPACLMEGVCVVISPLISLMKDQVDAACAAGLRAAFWNSSLAPHERSDVARRLQDGQLDLLYLSPERLNLGGFLDLLRATRVCMLAVDEAHCISEWGHDFRPDYLQLSQLVERFPSVPVAAFTATATHRVQQDIIQRLHLRQPFVVRASFDRPNLFYQVEPKDDDLGQIRDFLRGRRGQPAIVYRTTRNNVELTAQVLQAAGIRALPYHAGMDNDTRRRHQEAFDRDEVDVIVATIAFGMGIDKPNVRHIIHGDLPKTIESYYQETGRAGRDGAPAHCLLLFSMADVPTLRFFINQIDSLAERQAASRQLAQMISLAEVATCRRRQVLAYFGERYAPHNCGSCDVCCGQVTLADGSVDAQKLLSAVARTGERFGAEHVIGIVMGTASEAIRALGHDKIKTFGVGRDQTPEHWRVVLEALVRQGHLRGGQALAMTPKGREVLFGRGSFHLFRPQPVRVPRATDRPARPARKGRRRARPKTRSAGDSLAITWGFLRKGLGPAEIARQRGLTESTILGHMEVLIAQGRPVDVSRLVTPAARVELERLFAAHGMTSLGRVVKACNNGCTYGQARLVRALLLRAATA